MNQSDRHEDVVQFMQFDSDGNLFIFEPGAGCTGTPRMIKQGFSQEDLLFSSGKNGQDITEHVPNDVSNMISKDVKSLALKTHRLVPQVCASVSSRFVKFLSLLDVMLVVSHYLITYNYIINSF